MSNSTVSTRPDLGTLLTPGPLAPVQGKLTLHERISSTYCNNTQIPAISRLRAPSPPTALKLCGKHSMLGDAPADKHYAHRLWCHRWDCPVCGKFKADKLFKALGRVDVNGRVTLGHYTNYQEVSAAWSLFVRRLRYHFPGMKYLAMFRYGEEKTEIQVFFCGKLVTPDVVEKAWTDQGGLMLSPLISTCPIEDVRRQAQLFLQETTPLEKRSRMLKSSVRFFPALPEASSVPSEWDTIEWHRDSRSVEDIARGYEDQGYKVDWTSDDAFVASPGGGAPVPDKAA